jgi:hypothetical protein
MRRKVVEDWNRVVATGKRELLNELLSEDVVFHSPVVHSPQRGKELAIKYLSGAFYVLKNESFRYVREIIGKRDAVLEFVTEIDGIVINGVDMIKWDHDGKIVDFKVMVRPLKAINLLHQKMAEMLERLNAGTA